MTNTLKHTVLALALAFATTACITDESEAPDDEQGDVGETGAPADDDRLEGVVITGDEVADDIGETNSPASNDPRDGVVITGEELANETDDEAEAPAVDNCIPRWTTHERIRSCSNVGVKN